MRLKELNEDDIKRHLLERYHNYFDTYLRSKSVAELRTILDDQRRQRIENHLAAKDS